MNTIHLHARKSGTGRLGAVVFLLSLVLAWGQCAQAWPGKRDNLNKWLEKELYPHLKQRLGQQGSMQGQPFVMVAMQGETIEAEINDLAAYLRDKIRDELQTSDGIELVWRGAAKPWQNPRSLVDLRCAEVVTPRFLVGIDASYNDIDDKLQVVVKAQDLQDGAWVSGFTRRYQGSATDKQREALKPQQPDEQLRGARQLPFAMDQSTLLAAYLARDLGCQIRQQGTGTATFAMAPLVATAPGYFHTAVGLAVNYLGQLRELTQLQDTAGAAMILEADVHATDPDRGVYQLWMSALRQGGAQPTSVSLHSKAYAQLYGDAATIVPGTVNWPPGRELLADFQALAPATDGLCQADKPWLLGERLLDKDSRLRSGQCLALRVSAVHEAELYVFNQGASGQFTRMLPNSCQALSEAGNRLLAGQMLVLPEGGGTLKLDDTAGIERFYVVAVDHPAAKALLEQQIATIPDLCAGAASTGANMVSFEQTLGRLNTETSGHLQWRMVQFHHDP